MNLTNIDSGPFVHGIIRIQSETDAVGGLRTKDQFEILSRHHEPTSADEIVSPDSVPAFALHPIQTKVAKRTGNSDGVKEIPIRMFFNRADSSIRIGYRAYARETGQPMCSGDGKTAKRVTTAGDGTQTYSEHACPGSEFCAFAGDGDIACYRQVKMQVQIDGQEDDLSVFEVRSTSINSYKSLHAQLCLIENRLGGLRHVPLVLKIWGASNVLSKYDIFHCMRLEYDAPSEAEAYRLANAQRNKMRESGINDDNDSVFATQQSLESHFESADNYSADLHLSNHCARRSGSDSMTRALLRRMRKDDRAGQGGDNSPSGADFLAAAVRNNSGL